MGHVMMNSFLTYLIADSIIEGLNSSISSRLIVPDRGFRVGRNFSRLECYVQFIKRSEYMVILNNRIHKIGADSFLAVYSIQYSDVISVIWTD